MQAVIYAVRDFLPRLRSWVVRLMCDNAVTVAYIKNEGGGGGGTRSHTLMQMTKRLLKCCNSKAITLVPVYLPGVHNIQADSLSRVDQTLTTEWTMAMESLRPVFAKWGKLRIYLFATFANRRLVKFISPYPDPRAEWTDAMSMPWDYGRDLPVRVPVIQDGPASTAEDRSVTRSEGDFDRSTATGSIMVPRVDGPFPRRSDPAVRRRSRPTDTRHLDGRRGDRESSLPTVKSTRVETFRAILRAKGHSREAANMMSRCLRESSQQVYESHWSRFVAFCGTKRWHVFRVRSHHFSTFMMHLFRDGLLPSTLISHRTSVASVLRHWVYDPAADPHIKLLVRAFRLERPVQRRIMPKWDLHLVLSLLQPPFIFQIEVHWNRNIRDIMRSHISQWIVETVKEAYTQADRQYDRVTAHEVRALSASWAYNCQVALPDILAAAFWRSSGVFQNSYLRDMACVAEGMSTLGPVVVAQHVVDPGHLHPPP